MGGLKIIIKKEKLAYKTTNEDMKTGAITIIQWLIGKNLDMQQ